MVPAHAALGEERPGLSIIDHDVLGVIERLRDSIEVLAGRSLLITGVGGMIGGYLADVAAAINASSAVTRPVDIYLATRTMPTAQSRMGHLLARPDVEFLVGGDAPFPTLPARVDYVMHAASPASPKDFMQDPVGTLAANSIYLQALLDLAVRSDTAGFLYLSSSEVYGDPPESAIPTSEAYVGAVDPLSPRASYVEGKRFGEALCMAYHRQHGVPVSIVRPFHVHGPGLRLDDGRIVAELIRVGLTGEPFRLASDGSATRCYGYIADAVVGMYAAMWHGPGETFNIGVDSPETSILDLATTVAGLMGTPPPIVARGAGPVHLANAPRRSRPNLTKARDRLHYAPQIPFMAGLRRTIDWHLAQQVSSR